MHKILKKYPNLDSLTPEQAHALKVEIGDSIKWDGAPYERAVNKALVQMYGDINDAIKSQLPGIADDMKRWGNLYQADKALGKSIVRNNAGTGTPDAAPNPVKDTAKAAAWYVGKKAIGPAVLGGGYALYRLTQDK